jgi:hypothetical protein
LFAWLPAGTSAHCLCQARRAGGATHSNQVISSSGAQRESRKAHARHIPKHYSPFRRGGAPRPLPRVARRLRAPAVQCSAAKIEPQNRNSKRDLYDLVPTNSILGSTPFCRGRAWRSYRMLRTARWALSQSFAVRARLRAPSADVPGARLDRRRRAAGRSIRSGAAALRSSGCPVLAGHVCAMAPLPRVRAWRIVACAC